MPDGKTPALRTPGLKEQGNANRPLPSTIDASLAQVLSVEAGEPDIAPDRHLEYALRYLGLAVLEAPRIAPIVYEAAHEIGVAMAEMRSVASWAAVPDSKFFQHISPAEVASLLGIGGHP
jgi:hypothetical protein